MDKERLIRSVYKLKTFEILRNLKTIRFKSYKNTVNIDMTKCIEININILPKIYTNGIN